VVPAHDARELRWESGSFGTEISAMMTSAVRAADAAKKKKKNKKN